LLAASGAATPTGASSARTSPGFAGRRRAPDGQATTATVRMEDRRQKAGGSVASHVRGYRPRYAAVPSYQGPYQHRPRDVARAAAAVAAAPEREVMEAMAVWNCRLLIHMVCECWRRGWTVPRGGSNSAAEAGEPQGCLSGGRLGAFAAARLVRSPRSKSTDGYWRKAVRGVRRGHGTCPFAVGLLPAGPRLEETKKD
jgi:hypothetical protein